MLTLICFAFTCWTSQAFITSLQRHSFTMSIAEKKAQLPLKIAIAGAGVGGEDILFSESKLKFLLGTFAGYALQKKGFEVTVFEKAKQFSRFGGPIQLASNALSCIHDLSPELFEQIMVEYSSRLCHTSSSLTGSVHFHWHEDMWNQGWDS